MPHEFELRKEITLEVIPVEVWEAIATGAGIDGWFMGRNQVEPREGGRSSMTIGGQTEESVATYGWIVMLSAPTAWLSNLPAQPSNQSAIAVTVGGTNVATYSYRLNSGPWSEWTTVAVRIGRIPLRVLTALPISGSSRNRCKNSPWSSSAARMKRSFASASSGSALSIEASSFPSGF